MTDPDRHRLEELISGRMADYLDAMRSLDLDRISDFYLDVPDFRVYSDGQVLDRDRLVASVAGLGDALRSFDARWERVEVTPCTCRRPPSAATLRAGEAAATPPICRLPDGSSR